jgi:hypothetical protein
MSRAYCKDGTWGGCGRVFADTRAFDLHRTGDFAGTGTQCTRRCLSELEMVARGLVKHPAKRDLRGPVWTREVSLHVSERFKPFVARTGTSQGHSEGGADAA